MSKIGDVSSASIQNEQNMVHIIVFSKIKDLLSYSHNKMWSLVNMIKILYTPH